MHQEKQAKGWALREISTEEYPSRSRGSARPPRSWLLCLLGEAQCLCDSLCVSAWIEVLPE